jgi:hypothetical protein
MSDVASSFLRTYSRYLDSARAVTVEDKSFQNRASTQSGLLKTDDDMEQKANRAIIWDQQDSILVHLQYVITTS